MFTLASMLVLSSPALAQEEEVPTFEIDGKEITMPPETATYDQVLAHFAEQGLAAEMAEGLADSWSMMQFEASLTWQIGEVDLGDGLATLSVTPPHRFLGPQDAMGVLQAWGNPVHEPPLGMLFADGKGPFDENSIGVVFQYEEDGHVDDSDADDIDYDDLLKGMRDDTKQENEERRAMGLATVEIVGWAEPPRYDSSARQLLWAKELRFSGEESTTLNYDVRALGRKGVLSMNAVASGSQLAEVKSAMVGIGSGVAFNAGNAYADFDPELDEMAAYGIGALVAGKLAAKAGLFKGLLALLIAGKKFVIIGLIAVFALAKGVFGRRSD